MSSNVLFVLILIVVKDISTLSIGNVYSGYINRETIDQSDTFGYHIPKPIGYKGDEPIWPRSYGYSAEMFFDENGVGFPVRPRQQKLGRIIRPLQQGHQKYDDDVYDERKAIRDFFRRFKTS